MTTKKVEKLYNKLAIYAKKRGKLQKEFDEECREQYGFLFNECDFSIYPEAFQRTLKDEDGIIDTLDYGTDSLSFNIFDEMMRKAKIIKDAQRNGCMTLQVHA